MKFTCLQENLNRGLANVSKAVGGRLPITSSILMTAEHNQVKITSTNLEMAITAWIGAKVEESGTIAVPAKLLTDFVQSLPNDTVTISNSDSKLKLQCGGSKALLSIARVEDFPTIPELTNPVPLIIDPSDFCAAISKVAFTAAIDRSRPILTGIFLKVKDRMMTLAAADGFRLSVARTSVEGSYIETIIPAKLLIEVSRLVAGSKKPIGIAISTDRGQSTFKVHQELEILAQSLIGTYPPYQSLIPSSSLTEVTIKTGDLAFAIKSTSIFAQEGNGTLRFQLQDGKMTVSSPATEMGSNEVEVVSSQDGPDLKFAVNSRFARELLSVVQSDEIVIGINDGLSPIVFREVGNDCFMHIMMPMFLNW